MNLIIKEATIKDLQILMQMNRQLMEDEQFDRSVNDTLLKEKWSTYFSDPNFNILLFFSDENLCGYALVQVDLSPLYLRHFFIKREFRKMKLGTTCFNNMLEYLQLDELDLDVMSWNHRGYEFWKSLGFTERCKFMTFKKST